MRTRLGAFCAVLLAVSATAVGSARPAAAAGGNNGNNGGNNGGNISGELVPIFECSFKVSNGNYQTAWGYDNQTGSVQTWQVGVHNRFTPAPNDRGQPTTFQTGRHDNVVVVPWDGVSRLRYRLGADREVASTVSPCSSNPVPITGTGLSSVVVVSVLAVFGVFVDQLLRRRRRRARAANP